MQQLLTCLLLCASVFAQIDQSGFVAGLPIISDQIPFTSVGGAHSSGANPALLGPVSLLSSATVNLEQGTVTLPLYQGFLLDNPLESVWYILTDVSDQTLAHTFGINFAPQLGVGIGATRTATTDTLGRVFFSGGTVDFTPSISVVGNAWPFLNGSTSGSIGFNGYNPVAFFQNFGKFFNAPIVASGNVNSLNLFCNPNAQIDYSVVHDRVVSICPQDRTVTLRMYLGFSEGKPTWMLPMASTSESYAALYEATWFQSVLNETTEVCTSGLLCGINNMFEVQTNGLNVSQTLVSPQIQRYFSQGLNTYIQSLSNPTATQSTLSSLPVFSGIPTQIINYSPMWRVWFIDWTSEAENFGVISRLTNEVDIFSLNSLGLLMGSGQLVDRITGQVLLAPSDVLLDASAIYRIY